MPALDTSSDRTLRLPSAIVSTAGLATLSFGLIRLHEGFGDRNAWISIGAAALLLAAVTFVTPPPGKRGGFSLCRLGFATDQPGP
ncbi:MULTISPECIES: hypothetical protein [unclassified Streptomyces]|uniref:hypothetical protein n=1 Tax=unclassified Streptomyces TaxID=2593676 RepID=UPI002E0F2C38|nr:hypothetical protein OG457_31490 [Streptomyces sp. NBC_01207]WTA21069.1 hypothetical protein OG365_25225 [Streptomyces sp. NBC_00853]